jgi:hypothetical protein
LQDLTSPPHVHNDAHPHIWSTQYPIGVPGTTPPPLVSLGDPSLFEWLSSELLFKEPFTVEVPKTGGLKTIVEPKTAFDELAAWTMSRFHSEQDLLKAAPSFNYLTADGYAIDNENRVVAHYDEAKGTYEIDYVVVGNQFSELAPEAVRWTASMINFIHENVAPVCEEQLNIIVQGTGTVTATYTAPWPTSPGTCEGNCSNYFPAGKTITLTAPADGSFLGWSGDIGNCSATSTTCVVVMDNDVPKNITAAFKDTCVAFGVKPNGALKPGVSKPLDEIFFLPVDNTTVFWLLAIAGYNCDGQNSVPQQPFKVDGDPVIGCDQTANQYWSYDFLKGSCEFNEILGCTVPHQLSGSFIYYSPIEGGSITVDATYTGRSITIPYLAVRAQTLTGQTCPGYSIGNLISYPCNYIDFVWDGPFEIPVLP